MREICVLLGVDLVNPIHDLIKSTQSIKLSEYSNLADWIIQQDELTEKDIGTLLLCREKAREDKNWELADRIRDYLKEKEITVMDRPGTHSVAVYYPEQIDQ